MRKYDAAGRIMETDEGVLAAEPCSQCVREGFEVDCKVFAEVGGICAYCKKNGRQGCTAKLIASPPTVEQRVVLLEQRLAALETKQADDHAVVLRWFTRFGDMFRDCHGALRVVFKEFSKVWGAVFPGVEGDVRIDDLEAAIAVTASKTV